MLVLNKAEHFVSQNQIPCCSQLKYYIIIVSLKQGWATSVLEGHCPAEFNSNPN